MAGAKSSLERMVLLGFGAALIVLVLVGALAWRSLDQYQTSSSWVDHTHEVLNQLEQALTDVLTMQASVRGYALTGTDEMLRAYEISADHLPRTLQELRVLTADNPSHQKHIGELAALAAAAQDTWNQRIARRRQAGANAEADGRPFLQGQDTIDAFRRTARDMEDAERRLLDARFARAREAGRRALISIGAATMFAALVVIVAGFVVQRDLARRRAAESSLGASEERLRLMIDNVKDYAIVMLDPEGRVQSWNAGAHRIKGYAAEEIIGQHFSRFYPEDAIAAGAPRRMLTTAAAQGRVEDQAWRVRKDGSQFWGDIVITAVRGPAGNVIGYLKVTRDLSDQRQAQERIKGLNEDLQRRATLLETANRELEAFSYSVSHDLRAPLRHIDGFANLLTKRAGPMLDAEARRYVDTISRAAKQMGTLIDDLLAFSRIGRAPLRHELVDQQQLVNSIIAEGGFGVSGPPITWQVDPLPAVWADTALLRQVWWNLLANAVKYTSKTPEPRITIGSDRDVATGEHVLFVRDNGVGFDMAHVDKLFGVFQRLHGPTEFEGTGIGLANVRRIVLRHGGRTWAEGRVNEGATFYFSLPAVATAPA